MAETRQWDASVCCSKQDQIEKHPTTDSGGMEGKLSQTVESAAFYLRWGVDSRIQVLEPVALCTDHSPGLSSPAPDPEPGLALNVSRICPRDRKKTADA